MVGEGGAGWSREGQKGEEGAGRGREGGAACWKGVEKGRREEGVENGRKDEERGRRVKKGGMKG